LIFEKNPWFTVGDYEHNRIDHIKHNIYNCS
jgi:hypothetical protein